jgi:regulatory protein
MPEQDETLDRLLRARLRGAMPDDRDALNRATDALQRRGYGWEEISVAVSRLRTESEEES